MAKSGKDNENLTLTWGASCLGTDLDYDIYQLVIGSFGGHAPMICRTEGMLTKPFPTPAGSLHFLVVPVNPAWEGSYGTDSNGPKRPAAMDACLSRYIGTCP